MPPFWHRPRISPDFFAVPHEPPASERIPGTQWSAGEVVALIDRHLDAQRSQWPEDRNAELVDVLLDLRNVLTVPVIPGRPS